MQRIVPAVVKPALILAASAVWTISLRPSHAACRHAAIPRPASKDSQEVLLTSGRQAFALRLNQDWSAAWPVWMWMASQCEEMAPRYQGLFLAMDDCKPVLGGTHLLMTSSRGGVVLVKRADNTCAFYAESVNAHSAELVRDRWIVACSSLRGNELQVFNRFDENRPATKLAFVPLAGRTVRSTTGAARYSGPWAPTNCSRRRSSRAQAMRRSGSRY